MWHAFDWILFWMSFYSNIKFYLIIQIVTISIQKIQPQYRVILFYLEKEENDTSFFIQFIENEL